MDMKWNIRWGGRFGIVALAGALAVFGCSKAKQEAGSDAAVEASDAAASVSGSAGEFTADAPAMMSLAIPDAAGLAPLGWTKNADGSFTRDISRPKRGLTGTVTTTFKYQGTVSTTPYKDAAVLVRTLDVTRKVSLSGTDKTFTQDGTGTFSIAGGIAAPVVSISGSWNGTFANTAKKITMTLTGTSITWVGGKHTGGTITGSGESDGKTVAMTLTWASDGSASGSVTVDSDKWTIAITAAGEVTKTKA